MAAWARAFAPLLLLAALGLQGCPAKKVSQDAEAVTADAGRELVAVADLGTVDLRRVDSREPEWDFWTTDWVDQRAWESPLGKACETFDDCDGAYCADTQMGRICICGCCAWGCCECPPGSVAKGVREGPEIVFLCWPDHGRFGCAPCTQDDDCTDNWWGQGLCLDMPDGRRACAEACWWRDLCLPGHHCESRTSPDGLTADVCVSDATGLPENADGACPNQNCLYAQDGADCDDGNDCTVGDHCANFDCVGTGTLPECESACTDDVCAEADVVFPADVVTPQDVDAGPEVTDAGAPGEVD